MAFAILPSQSIPFETNMKPSKYMPKIETLDGNGFWNTAFAHQKGKLLKKINVPEDQIIKLVNIKYMELPAALRYEIETSGITKKELQ